jgi:hypothetical protein
MQISIQFSALKLALTNYPKVRDKKSDLIAKPSAMFDNDLIVPPALNPGRAKTLMLNCS